MKYFESTMTKWLSICVLAGGWVACSSDVTAPEDTTSSSTSSGGSSSDYGKACATAEGVAKKLGCTFDATGCFADEEAKGIRCSVEAEAWMACVATDTSQCICQSTNNKLNCEGSYKPNEGPAKCIAENKALEACIGS